MQVSFWICLMNRQFISDKRTTVKDTLTSLSNQLVSQSSIVAGLLRQRKQYRSKEYATEAAHGVLTYTFEKLSLNRIAAITHTENKGSDKVLQKLGFQFKKLVYLDGFEGQNKLIEIDLN